jgi:DNA-binding response OmpR family regulator
MSLSGKTILIVDDEKDICDLLQMELLDHQARSVVAHSVTEAWDILKNSPVDLVTLVLMTGFSDIAEKEALAQGARAVVAKPFAMKDMVKVCEQILEV